MPQAQNKERNPACDIRHKVRNVTVRAIGTETKQRNVHKKKFTPLPANFMTMSVEENVNAQKEHPRQRGSETSETIIAAK